MSEPAKIGATLLPCALCLVVFSAAMLPVSASGAEPADYRGTYRIVDQKAAEAARDKAVKEVVAAMPALFRRIARKRLMASATVLLFFEFEPSPGHMTISTDRSSGWTTDLAATEVKFKPDRGKSFLLSRWMEDGALSTLGRRRNGVRDTRFELSVDGSRLVVITTIHNKRLPAPVTYETVYTREVVAAPAVPDAPAAP
jgi:hypothetical protein